MIAITLIVLTICITLVSWFLFPVMIKQGMLMPYRVWRERRWYQLLTGGFLHADVTHLAFNMITLFFFGPYLEATIGSHDFFWLYLAGLVLSSIPSTFRYKNDPNYASLGASGAVEAILFSFIMLYPMQPIYIFLIPIGIPSLLFGGIFVAYSIYASKKQMGRINHDAHLAGAATGILYTLLFIPESWKNFVNQLGF